ncbi:MAG: hypothetical protein QOH97_3245 [Actinoplanes sp.]|nr:hypothetical protein [Actinoplanes sp.]
MINESGDMTEHEVGYDGMWAQPDQDPRSASSPVGELATIRDYLSNYRHTLRMKCEGMSHGQLATRSVPPSTMSLLGLVRHLARVEHHWFVRCLQGHGDIPRLYSTGGRGDVDFDDAVPDPAVVQEAFGAWQDQITAADHWLDGITDLGATVRMPNGEQASVREILVHLIEEYARHCGHADLLRECIDGRTGQ